MFDCIALHCALLHLVSLPRRSSFTFYSYHWKITNGPLTRGTDFRLRLNKTVGHSWTLLRLYDGVFPLVTSHNSESVSRPRTKRKLPTTRRPTAASNFRLLRFGFPLFQHWLWWRHSRPEVVVFQIWWPITSVVDWTPRGQSLTPRLDAVSSVTVESSVTAVTRDGIVVIFIDNKHDIDAYVTWQHRTTWPWLIWPPWALGLDLHRLPYIIISFKKWFVLLITYHLTNSGSLYLR